MPLLADDAAYGALWWVPIIAGLPSRCLLPALCCLPISSGGDLPGELQFPWSVFIGTGADLPRAT
ncbi:hypothetical protein N5T31_19605 [Escherichia coli]|uniref:hypothetical protein n=1 Tax=Escherichia coli TaxID=562 RepID=UPI0022279572|nr:hypothetical protein [Escherichia coli]MCW3441754.1 hypothetical protein [Escherichia coli]